MSSPRSVLSTDNNERHAFTTNCNKKMVHIDDSQQNKSVSFNPSVLVYKDKLGYSLADRKCMHYTRDEMRNFSREIRQFQINSKQQHQQQLRSFNMNLIGIEAFVNPTVMEHKQRHKLQAVLAVLMEQDRQYMELGYFTPIDFDAMSKVYHHATEESQEEARERAMHHREMIRYNNETCMPRANTPMAKAA
eukprot:scaffold1934_cov79-Cylindrotheca_fusiformis.AAC.2